MLTPLTLPSLSLRRYPANHTLATKLASGLGFDKVTLRGKDSVLTLELSNLGASLLIVRKDIVSVSV